MILGERKRSISARSNKKVRKKISKIEGLREKKALAGLLRKT